MFSVSEAQLMGWITALLLPMFRILGLIASAPILSSRSIPARAKLGLAVVLAIVIAPFAPPPEGFTIASDSAWPAIVRELVIGVSVGFLARLVLLVFEIAGELIGLQIGLSYAGYFSPVAGTGNAVGSLSSVMASWLFVTLNGPLLVLGCLIRSYERFPTAVSITGGNSVNMDKVFQLLTDIFGMALVLALPAISLILLINFAMGIASKLAPQMNIFSVGFPILLSCGLGMLAIVMPLFEPTMVQAMTLVFSFW